MGVKRVPLLSG